MVKRILVLLVAGIGLAVMSGCAAQLSEADRALLNSALDSSKASSATVQQAEAAATRAEQAAGKAEAAAAQADASAQSAAASASQATTLAGQVQQNAVKAEKAFDMKLKK